MTLPAGNKADRRGAVKSVWAEEPFYARPAVNRHSYRTEFSPYLFSPDFSPCSIRDPFDPCCCMMRTTATTKSVTNRHAMPTSNTTM
jgi:hypothetical protein